MQLNKPRFPNIIKTSKPPFPVITLPKPSRNSKRLPEPFR
ncbi:hypothetical protein EIKCOROL_00742 [Eikenella corrodens ATCC 23834]|uniref:Runt domain-containing protein n=1 Tax=Eikenella corrodens ATCC 23834 TaxID=546274 RepID=C0DTR2_EIKCO|nr:hypothetical protein EIKCOROL_00742 [Eikenella corrodens ATCC 23834]